MNEARVIVVKAEGCPGCEEFVKDITEKPEIREQIRTTLWTDKIEVVDVTKDGLAANIVTSLQSYEVPMVTTLRDDNGKKEVCQLNDKLEVVRCAELKEMPTE